MASRLEAAAGDGDLGSRVTELELAVAELRRHAARLHSDFVVFAQQMLLEATVRRQSEGGGGVPGAEKQPSRPTDSRKEGQKKGFGASDRDSKAPVAGLSPAVSARKAFLAAKAAREALKDGNV